MADARNAIGEDGTELDVIKNLPVELNDTLLQYCNKYRLPSELQKQILGLFYIMHENKWGPKPSSTLRVLSVGSVCSDYFPLKVLYESKGLKLLYTNLDTLEHISQCKEKLAFIKDIHFLEMNTTLTKTIEEQKRLKEISNVDLILFYSEKFPGNKEVVTFLDNIIDFINDNAKIVFVVRGEISKLFYSCVSISPWYTTYSYDNEKELNFTPQLINSQGSKQMFMFHCLGKTHPLIDTNIVTKFKNGILSLVKDHQDSKVQKYWKELEKTKYFVDSKQDRSCRLDTFIMDSLECKPGCKGFFQDLLSKKTQLIENIDYKFISIAGPTKGGFYLILYPSESGLKRLHNIGDDPSHILTIKAKLVSQ